VARHSRASGARVELSETADKVVLEVHDDGVGFDPAGDLVGGLDHFGLAGMRERVELAGGTWTVWSRKGAGTVLTRDPAQGPGGGMNAAPPAPRVLLVDDNRGFRLELRLLLEDCGIEVVAEGENGQEAVELAAGTDPDVVLMELRMPVMDGLEAARALRDRVRPCP
jgi:hypothetical protein